MALAPNALNNMQEKFDKLAILLSGVCAVHCIFTPVIASVIPLFSAAVHHGGHVHDFWFHKFILIFILPVSIFALVMGYRAHRKLFPIAVAALGLLTLTFVALFAEELFHHGLIKPEGETLLTIIGGLIHAIGHILNFQASRKNHQHCSSV